MFEPVWLTADEVIALNEVIVEATGETHFVRDLRALEGALSRPQAYHVYKGISDVHILAAHIIQAIGKAHAFEQGNKRVAWTAARLFLAKNGYRYLDTYVPQDVIGNTIYDLMSDGNKFDELVDLLYAAIQPLG